MANGFSPFLCQLTQKSDPLYSMGFCLGNLVWDHDKDVALATWRGRRKRVQLVKDLPNQLGNYSGALRSGQTVGFTRFSAQILLISRDYLILL